MNSPKSLLPYPEFLADIAATVGEALQRNGSTEESAVKIGQETAEAVRKNYGGQLLYIPKGERYELSQRDLEIWNEFNGRNIQTLAAKHALSVPQMYRIIQRVGLLAKKRAQPDLFSGGG